MILKKPNDEDQQQEGDDKAASVESVPHNSLAFHDMLTPVISNRQLLEISVPELTLPSAKFSVGEVQLSEARSLEIQGRKRYREPPIRVSALEVEYLEAVGRLLSVGTRWMLAGWSSSPIPRLVHNVPTPRSLTPAKQHRPLAEVVGETRIRGIPNYGQTCYLNVILQALASTKAFGDFCQRQDTPVARTLSKILTDINSNQPVDPRPLLRLVDGFPCYEQQDAQELLQALVDACVTKSVSLVAPVDDLLLQQPEPKVEMTSDVLPQIYSEENLPSLLVPQTILRPSSNYSVGTLTDSESLETSNRHVLQQTNALSPSPLHGWTGTVLVCESCGTVRPVQNALVLDVPVVPTVGTLTDCLRDYCAPECVHVECRQCTLRAQLQIVQEEYDILVQTARGLCELQQAGKSVDLDHLVRELQTTEINLERLREARFDDDAPAVIYDDLGVPPRELVLERRDARKRVLLSRLPAILSVHVQRRYYDRRSQQMGKSQQHVEFPEILDVWPYCAFAETNAGFGAVRSAKAARTQCLYRLVAVLEHLGGPSSGHYVCYRRDLNGNWLWISDDTVRSVEWGTVRKCQAYMLFYEAI